MKSVVQKEGSILSKINSIFQENLPAADVILFGNEHAKNTKVYNMPMNIEFSAKCETVTTIQMLLF